MKRGKRMSLNAVRCLPWVAAVVLVIVGVANGADALAQVGGPQFDLEVAGALALDKVVSGYARDAGVTTDTATTETTTTPAVIPTATPQPPPLAGSDWSGALSLVNGSTEMVTAQVTQSGTNLYISTTAKQKYGRYFQGTVKANGSILIYDQTTGEDWSTKKGIAYDTRIDLYDYVNIDDNGYTDMDRLYLTRPAFAGLP